MKTPRLTLATTGIHHITAIASSARENLAFYEAVLGLRLVKQTVNFDDPGTYHLYYGDAGSSPGTIITFFPWEKLPAGKSGTGMVTAIAFAVPVESVDFWRDRLHNNNTVVTETKRFGEPVLQFTDPHGLPLELIGSDSPPSVSAWREGPIPGVHVIRGFHSATSVTRSPDPSHVLLTEIMGMEFVGTEGSRRRYRMTATHQPGHMYDVVIDADAPKGQQGGGTVHHIAFRATDRNEQEQWQYALRQNGLNPTSIMDRNYFTSIYFHEPGGVLFEIATDPPGFAVDETPERLGEALKLPARYESMRSEIEKQLPPLRPVEFRHEFERPLVDKDDGSTIVSLHGTGGDERDLVELARAISEEAAILSPRGKVSENGMTRFFQRSAEGVPDENDVVRRTHELADFISSATRRYGRNPEHLVAMGYSNGASIAAAIILLRPEIFNRAILFRPMMPLRNIELPDLTDTRVLILKGLNDDVIPGESTDRLVDALNRAGAAVDVVESPAGHEVTAGDLDTASRWVSGKMGRDPIPAADTLLS